MTSITRRAALRGSISFGVVSVFGMARAARADIGRPPVTLPTHPMQLQRELTRELGDGNLLIVRRSWEIGFARQGRGIAITGHQSDVAVEAPEKLAPLSRLEEQRSTDAMWPILLTEDGHIVAAGGYVKEADFERAIDAAEKIIAARQPPASAMQAHRQYLAEIQRAGAPLFDQMPQDLFFPSTEPRSLTREISLPEGENGQFMVSFRAETYPENGWLQRAEREIVTRIGTSERRATDVWMMRAMQG